MDRLGSNQRQMGFATQAHFGEPSLAKTGGLANLLPEGWMSHPAGASRGPDGVSYPI